MAVSRIGHNALEPILRRNLLERFVHVNCSTLLHAHTGSRWVLILAFEINRIHDFVYTAFFAKHLQFGAIGSLAE